MRKSDQRLKRKVRIRKKVYGDSNKPRLAVYKSNKNIYVQAIDDLNHTTIGSASTLSKELKVERLTIDAAKKVGELMGDILNKNKIEEAVFDRGGYIYHGRVQECARDSLWAYAHRTDSGERQERDWVGHSPKW